MYSEMSHNKTKTWEIVYKRITMPHLDGNNANYQDYVPSYVTKSCAQ